VSVRTRLPHAPHLSPSPSNNRQNGLVENNCGRPLGGRRVRVRRLHRRQLDRRQDAACR